MNGAFTTVAVLPAITLFALLSNVHDLHAILSHTNYLPMLSLRTASNSNLKKIVAIFLAYYLFVKR